MSVWIRVAFDSAAAVCGGCGACGGLSFWCGYTRWVDVLENGAPASAEVALIRCRCGLCGKTHVVAPGELVIPYVRHSLGFILSALEAYAKREKPVRQIAADFSIAVSTLYEWAGRFREHCGLLLGKLASASGGMGAHIETALGKPDLGLRLLIFVEGYGFCFMQEAKPAGATRFFTLRGCLAIRSGIPP